MHGRIRHCWVPVAGLLVGAVVTVTASVADGGGAHYDRAYVAAVQADTPGLPMPLPTRLPDGYRFLGFFGAVTASAGGSRVAVSRTVLFTSDDVTVTVCVEDTAAGGALCPGSETGSDLGLEVVEAGVRRTVVFGGGTVADLASWRDLTWSQDLTDVPWL